MGFHICEYCRSKPNRKNYFSHLSSGDVTLIFDSGRAWQMPDMILHYVADHRWQPPTEFVEDVLQNRLTDERRAQAKAISTRVGYLSGPFEKGQVSDEFIWKLAAHLQKAEQLGNRIQTRGI